MQRARQGRPRLGTEAGWKARPGVGGGAGCWARLHAHSESRAAGFGAYRLQQFFFFFFKFICSFVSNGAAGGGAADVTRTADKPHAANFYLPDRRAE